jgi:serine phosphatase RsbU (regulator of sigma subunit)
LRWAPVVWAGVAVVAFVIFVGWIYLAVGRAGAYRQELRDARAKTTAVLTLQLDEETALRGFTSTRRRTFLQPYDAATLHIGRALSEERAALISINPATNLTMAADEEARIHQLWASTVAVPLLNDPGRTDSVALQMRGKSLIDEFRLLDEAISNDLLVEMRSADQAFQRTLTNVLGLGVLGVAALSGFGVLLRRWILRAESDIAEQRQLYLDEKRVADALQRAYIQGPLPTVRGLRLSASYEPAEERAAIGGDWYDAFEVPDGRVLVSIGDVCGHGIEAAVSMGRARQAVFASALLGEDAATIMQRVNASLLMQGSPMVTAACGFIDLQRRLLTYSIAGHPPPVMVDPGGRATFLPHGGLPLAVLADAAYREFSVPVADGCVVILYTDGLLEYERDVPKGERRLLACASRLAANPVIGNEAKALHEAVLGGAQARDDVAVLTLRFGTRSRRARPSTWFGSRADEERTPHVSHHRKEHTMQAETRSNPSAHDGASDPTPSEVDPTGPPPPAEPSPVPQA